MERILQHLGFTSKKPSKSYHLQSPGGYAAFGTNQSNAGHSHFRGNKAFGRGDDMTWMEMTVAGDRNGSKDQIVTEDNEVVITTNIETRFEDVEGQHARSSTGSHSADDLTRKQSPDSRKVV